MKVLVTGGAGFIGSHLSRYLLAQGNSVRVVDNLSTGRVENVRNLLDQPGFQLEVDSVLNSRVMSRAMESCDTVVHLAAAVGVQLIVSDPVGTIETNVKGTEAVLELAEKAQKRVLLASTSEVYGKSSKIPFSEDDDLVFGPTTRARWSYACSKAIDEFLGQAYWQKKEVPVTIVRLFNTVGPGQLGRYGMVLPTFVRQALEGRPLTVFGAGTQSRCFCHVEDVVKALGQILREQKTVGEVYNLGSDEEVTILALAERVLEITGSSSGITVIPYEDAYAPGFEDMLRRVPDLQKIREAIGFSTSYDLNRIIRSIVRHTRSTAAAGEDHLESFEQDQKIE